MCSFGFEEPSVDATPRRGIETGARISCARATLVAQLPRGDQWSGGAAPAGPEANPTEEAKQSHTRVRDHLRRIFQGVQTFTVGNILCACTVF